MVDLLASEYGWAKNKILYHTYFDEVIFLLGKINKRKINEYRMQLAIAQNPHVEQPNKLWDMFDNLDDNPVDEEFDKAGFEALKSRMQNSSKIKVK